MSGYCVVVLIIIDPFKVWICPNTFSNRIEIVTSSNHSIKSSVIAIVYFFSKFEFRNVSIALCESEVVRIVRSIVRSQIVIALESVIVLI